LTNLSPNPAQLTILHCGYHAEDGMWCDCDVWMIVAQLWRRCWLMLQNSKVSGIQPCKVIRNWVQKSCLL